MYIAVGIIDLAIPSSRSLKDKRQVIRRLVERMRHRLNLAVSEVDDQDLRQRALIGWCSVSSNPSILRELEQKVRRLAEGIPEIESFQIESECMKWGE